MSWLENNSIKLRAIELSDIEILYKLENDSSLWKVSNTLAPFSKYILQKYIENSSRDIFDLKELRLVIDLVGNNSAKAIGLIDIFDFDPFHKRAGLGIIIDSEFRNNNYASIALELVINYSFKYLNLNQLYCNISEDNLPSIKLFQKLGFEITGIKKNWLCYNNQYKNELFLQLMNNM